MANRTKKLLNKVREVIIRGWTQHTYARTVNGDAVSPESPNAVCWCMIGAVNRAVHEMKADSQEGVDLRITLQQQLRHEGHLHSYLHYWNDDGIRSKEQVLALIERTERRLNAEEAAKLDRDTQETDEAADQNASSA